MRAYIDLLGMSAVPDDYIKSLDIAKQFYELNPHNEYVALKYADHLFELERYDESQVIYNKVKSLRIYIMLFGHWHHWL